MVHQSTVNPWQEEFKMCFCRLEFALKLFKRGKKEKRSTCFEICDIVENWVEKRCCALFISLIIFWNIWIGKWVPELCLLIEKSCLDWFFNTRTERVQFEMTCLPVLPSVLESRFILYMNDLIFVCSYIAFVAGARKYLMGARKNWAREGDTRGRGSACPRAPWQSFPPFPITWRPLRDLSKQCWHVLYPRSKFICYKDMIIERWGTAPTINTQH